MRCLTTFGNRRGKLEEAKWEKEEVSNSWVAEDRDVSKREENDERE